MPYQYDFRIATTQALMRVLPRWGIPWPTSWTYMPYSRIEKRGNGQDGTFGFPTATWTWDEIGQYQLDRLLSYFAADGDGSVIVYMRTYLDNGAALVTDDFRAIMHRPVDGGGKTIVPQSNPTDANLTDVTIRFSRLEAL